MSTAKQFVLVVLIAVSPAFLHAEVRQSCGFIDLGAKHYAMSWIRGEQIAVQWVDCEAVKGVYDFSAAQKQLDAITAAGKFAIIKINGNHKPKWLWNEVPYIKGVQLSSQVFDNDTLMYWHPSFVQAYQNFIEAYANWVSKQPSIIGVRMNYNAIGTEHTYVEPQYRALSNWTIPPDTSPAPTEFTQETTYAYRELIAREFADHFNGVCKVFIRCNIEDSILEKLRPDFESGRLGWFHTGASMEQNQIFRKEWRYSRFLEFCRTGKTYGFTENCGWRKQAQAGGILEGYELAQWAYWRFLSELHCGVSYIGVFSFVIQEAERNPEFAACWPWVDRYVGHHADPGLSPGAWVALRGRGDQFPGDYTFHMRRLEPDSSTEVRDVGKSKTIYGAWARRLPAGEKMAFALDDGLFGGLPLKASHKLRVRVVYFNRGTGNWEVRCDTKNNAEKTILSVTNVNSEEWKVAVAEVIDGCFANRAPGGADICIVNTGSDGVVFHMIEISRHDITNSRLRGIEQQLDQGVHAKTNTQ